MPVNQWLQVRIEEISDAGKVKVSGEITATLWPVQTEELEVGQRLQVEVDGDDYPLAARTLQGRQVWYEDSSSNLGEVAL